MLSRFNNDISENVSDRFMISVFGMQIYVVSER